MWVGDTNTETIAPRNSNRSGDAHPETAMNPPQKCRPTEPELFRSCRLQPPRAAKKLLLHYPTWLWPWLCQQDTNIMNKCLLDSFYTVSYLFTKFQRPVRPPLILWLNIVVINCILIRVVFGVFVCKKLIAFLAEASNQSRPNYW